MRSLHEASSFVNNLLSCCFDELRNGKVSELVLFLTKFPRKAVNLHISMLPWNRGASPNLWSFVNGTPKGVTIHIIDEGLDTGDILLLRQVFFDESVETFESSYLKLHSAVQELFRDNWQQLKEGAVRPIKQGSFHTARETEDFVCLHGISWKERIADVKQRLTHASIYQHKRTQASVGNMHCIGGRE